MQLILEPESIGDIKTKMATQAESSVNGDFSDIKKEINSANKENNPNIGDCFSAEPDKSQINKTVADIDRLPSESVNESVYKEENSQSNNENANENKKCNLEIIETLNNGDLIDNSNHIVIDSTTDGLSCGQDDNKSECEHPSLEKKNTDAEINIESSRNEESVRLTGNEVTENKLELSNPEKTTSEKCDNALPTESFINITHDIDIKVQETESPLKQTLQVFNIRNSEDVLSNNLIAPDANKTLECSISSEKTKIPDESTNGDQNLIEETSSIVNKEDLMDTNIINTENNDLVDEDKASEVPAFITNNNDANALTEETIKEYNKSDETVNEKHPEDVTVDKVGIMCNDGNESHLLMTTKKSETLVTDEKEPQLTIEELVKNNECNPSRKESSSSDLSNLETLPAMDEIYDISMDEPTASDTTDEKKVLESSVVQDNACVVSSPELCSEKVLVDDEKEIENVPMETDDVEIVDLDKGNKELNVNEASSNESVSKEIKVLEIAETELTSEKHIDKSTTDLTLNECVEIKDNSEAPNTYENNIEGPVSNNYKEMKPMEKDRENMEIMVEDDINIVENKSDVIKSKEKEKSPERKENNKDKKPLEADQENVEIIDEDDIKIIETMTDKIKSKEKEKSPERKEPKTLPVVCKLSNTLNILSDDEEEEPAKEAKGTEKGPEEKQCIDIDDDDDIMLIEEDTNSKVATTENKIEDLDTKEGAQPLNDKVDLETPKKETTTTDISELSPTINEKDSPPLENMKLDSVPPQTEKLFKEESENKPKNQKPLLPQNFLKTAKKNLADMTRDELEDFCILRIVESIVDRSNLSDIKTKMKTMAQNLEDFRKRAQMLTKQNRDLQVVVKSVQEEQKKRANTLITPLKITRSVGMQVLMNDKLDYRKKGPIPCQPAVTPALSSRPVRAVQTAKNLKAPGTAANIPVPRKVPVSNSPAKALTSPANNVGKSSSPNGVWNQTPAQKAPEKRTHSRMQSTSVTVDLTDDEPPAKINNKNSPVPPVRVIPPQNLLAQQRPFVQTLNSPRKVYIPISGPQGQNIRPGQTLMMKSVPPPGPRQRVPTMPRIQQIPARVNKQVTQRHPAPLPDAMKQYTPPTWKALPPAPDLKLSKVENGIVISWKIDGYPEGGYETIASYQLYAYQETSAPPCTTLWKKIGDVKALPLPMACTLTQFMAGFKYYFAVRAVDVRSRLGPFSLPGSILLLNKM